MGPTNRDTNLNGSTAAALRARQAQTQMRPGRRHWQGMPCNASAAAAIQAARARAHGGWPRPGLTARPHCQCADSGATVTVTAGGRGRCRWPGPGGLTGSLRQAASHLARQLEFKLIWGRLGVLRLMSQTPSRRGPQWTRREYHNLAVVTRCVATARAGSLRARPATGKSLRT
jgi:hypothetical protein